MRISDWSSDVCSSDLEIEAGGQLAVGLVDGVGQLVGVDLGHDIEGGHGNDRNGGWAGQVSACAQPGALFVTVAAGSAMPHRSLLRAPPRAGNVARCRSLPRSSPRSEQHTSELESLMSISSAVLRLKKSITEMVMGVRLTTVS